MPLGQMVADTACFGWSAPKANVDRVPVTRLRAITMRMRRRDETGERFVFFILIMTPVLAFS
jgi:hypothetical protein